MPPLARLLRPVLQPVVIRWRVLRERAESGVAWNPLDRGFQIDPFPTYHRLLEKDPVHYSRLLGGWVISRHEDIGAILRDHRRFSNDSRRAEVDGLRYLDREDERRSMLMLDPPDHTRLRALVTKAFTPKVIAGMRPHIERIVDDLLDEVAGRDRFDVIDALAFPLPVIVISQMLGVPPEDRERFKEWSHAVARVLEPTITAEEGARAMAATQDLDRYFSAIIEERRREPREDIISALIQAEDDGTTLSHIEMLTMLRLLLVAGNETTTNLIGNGLLALLRHPDQYDLLRARPELIEDGIEELLRYDSPVQTDGRTALEDIELGGRHIRRGQQAILLLGAANRDPEAFPDPDRLDVTRGSKSHLAFGRGIHHCLGAPLARVEGQVAFERLLARHPRLRYAGPAKPDFRPNVVLRGLRTLPVEAVRAPAHAEREPSAAAAAP